MERELYKFNNICIKNIKDTDLMQKFAITCIVRKETRRKVIMDCIASYVKKHTKTRIN